MEDYDAPDTGHGEDEAEEKLRHARQLFEESVDHCRDFHTEAHRAQRFYHNTRNEGQWESLDLAALRDDGRPAFSFNIVKDKADSFMGIYSDAQRYPMVQGSGSEDKLLAEVIDIAKDQTLEDAGFERKKSGMLKTGTISGECGMHVEVVASPKGKGWIQINLYRILPFELHWDAASIEPDRSDARHVFWDRWLAKGEFKHAYPDQAEMWDQMSKAADADSGGDDASMWGELGYEDSWEGWDDYDGDRHSRYYFDRQKRKVRVIRYEYKEYVKQAYATHMVSGQRRPIDDQQRERVEFAISLGEPWEIEDVDEEVVKVCEFVGPKLLAEYDSPGPFDGFSIVDYCYMMDEEEGVPYGLVRNLFDPQMELNKSKSLEIEYLAQATAPGMRAEEGALLDEDQASAEDRRPGGIVITKKDALSQNRVQDKQITPPSPAIMARAASALDLMDRISGIPSSGEVQPASQQEAATTVALRYHKSRQVVQDPISNFEHATNEIVRRVVEAITRAMPDDQIEALISNDGRFRVGQGMVVEMVPDPKNPQGQPVPRSRALLRNLRGLHYDIELEHGSDNSTLRMLECQLLMQMQQAGFQVDPEVMMETSTSSRSQRERLKAYVKQVQASQSQAAQQQAQMFEKQAMQAAQLQAGKQAEDARHNRTQESLQAEKQQTDVATKIAEIIERSDENERAFFLDMLDQYTQQRQQATGAR